MHGSIQSKNSFKASKKAAVGIATAILSTWVLAPLALANPVGPTVAAGTANFATNGNTFTVTNSPNAIINWQQFNIGQNELTRFVQQSAQSAVLNRIGGGSPSQVLGGLQSNGRVFLVNPNGIIFGNNAVVDVAGLVASTLNLSNADFLANKLSFAGGGGSLSNQGSITTPVGGSVYLIGGNVSNQGLIRTPQGQVLLAAGNSVSLADSGTPNLSVTLSANGNKAVNLGEINASGGRIDIYGALIDQQGVVRADSASMDSHGRVTLKASDTTSVAGTVSASNAQGSGGQIDILGDKVVLAGSASVDASGSAGGGTVLIGGDWQGSNAAVQNATATRVDAGAIIKADATDNGNGGKVVAWSSAKTSFDGLIFARGGANGGDGGAVETSGHTLGVTGMVSTLAPKGKGGSWLLDPAIICIVVDPSGCSTSAQNITPSAVEQALALNSAVTYDATDYFLFSTSSISSSAPWTLSASAPNTGSLVISAPYVMLSGSFDAVANAKTIDFSFKATSGTSSSFSSKSGVIDIFEGGEVFRTLGNLTFNADKTINIASDANFQARSVNFLAKDFINYSGNGAATAPAGFHSLGAHGINDTNGPVNTTVSMLAPYIKLGGTVYVEPGVWFNAYTDDALAGTSASYAANTGTIDVQATFLGGSGGNTLSNTALKRGFTLGANAINGSIALSQMSSSASVTYSPTAELPSGNWNYLELATKKLGATVSGSIDAVSLTTKWGNNPSGWSMYVGTPATDPLCANGLCLNSQLANLTAKGVLLGTGVYNYALDATGNPTSFHGMGDIYYNANPGLTGTPEALGMAGWKVVIGSPVSVAKNVFVEAYDTFTNSVGANAFNGVHYDLAVPSGAALSGLTPTVLSNAYPDYPCSLTGYSSCAKQATDSKAYTAEAGSKAPASTVAYIDKKGTAVTPPPVTPPPVTPPSAITYAGIYSGTYSGTSSGTWTLTISSSGAISGTAINAADKSVTNLVGNATASGGLSFASGTGSDGETFSGSYNPNSGILSGTWAWPVYKESGQFSGGKQGADSPAVIQVVSQLVNDTCTNNPAMCASTSTIQQQLSGNTSGNLGQSAGAPVASLTVDAKLTVTESKPTTGSGDSKTVSGDSSKGRTADAGTPLAPKSQASQQKQEARAADEKKSTGELKQEAQRASSEAKSNKAEAKKTEAEAKKVEGEAKKAEGEAKKAEGEAKKAEGVAKKAESEGKKAESDAKQAEAEAKTAKTAEHKAVAEAKKSDAEARKAQADSKQAEAGAKQAEAGAKKAEAEMKQAEVAAKRDEAGAKRAEGDAKQAQAEHKQAVVAAKEAKTPEQKAAAEKLADDKRIEAVQKSAEANVKRAKAEEKKAEAEQKKSEADAHLALAEAKKAEGEAKQSEANAHKAAASAKQDESKAEHAKSEGKPAEAKQAETLKAAAEQKHAAEEKKAETKKIEAESKQAEAQHKQRTAETRKAEQQKRVEARREAAVKTFAKSMIGAMGIDKLAEMTVLRHEYKTEILKPALDILEKNPSAANLPACGTGAGDVCMPAKPAVAAQVVALSSMAPPLPVVSFLPQIERKVAVLIGINQYQSASIPKLDSAVPDAEAVARLLQDKMGYQVHVVRDASKADIVKSLNDVAKQVGAKDSVTIYYAGHGYMMEDAKGGKESGYWIPADGTTTSPANWLSNSDISKLLANIPAKQVMLISDSCYSGALTKEQKVTAASDPEQILGHRSVVVMSSGGEEPVSDEGKEGHSIFAWSLMDKLQKVNKFDTGNKVFEATKASVTEEFPQVPQYGAATAAGHTQGGDYLFEMRSYK
ncbi:MAG: caspase family protein [Sterolibacterium sp.]|nr:caspase family protein [Sterolibacterium sp.]